MWEGNGRSHKCWFATPMGTTRSHNCWAANPMGTPGGTPGVPRSTPRYPRGYPGGTPGYPRDTPGAAGAPPSKLKCPNACVDPPAIEAQVPKCCVNAPIRRRPEHFAAPIRRGPSSRPQRTHRRPQQTVFFFWFSGLGLFVSRLLVKQSWCF